MAIPGSIGSNRPMKNVSAISPMSEIAAETAMPANARNVASSGAAGAAFSGVATAAFATAFLLVRAAVADVEWRHLETLYLIAHGDRADHLEQVDHRAFLHHLVLDGAIERDALLRVGFHLGGLSHLVDRGVLPHRA